MRNLIVAAVALLVGLVIGALGPREDLREAEARIAELETKLAAKNKAGRLSSGFLNLPRRWDPPPAQGAAPTPGADGEEEAPVVAEAAPAPRAAEGEEAEEGGEGRLEIPAERLDEVRTGLELRRTQARAALIERTHLDEDQQEAFDTAVSKMNDGLEDIAADVADILREEREPTRREAMHLAADALDILLEADQSIQGSMNEDQYNAAGEEAVDPLSYIDPRLVDLLQEL